MKPEKSLTAREWLMLHRSEYIIDNVFKRADCINACHKETDIGIRNVRRRMSSIEREEQEEISCSEFYDDMEKPFIHIDDETGFASMSLISQVPQTAEDMIEMIGLDMTVWEMTKNVVNFWGNAENPNYQTKVWLVRKVPEGVEKFLDNVMEQMKGFAPVYPPLVYTQFPEGNLLEIGLNDLHLGLQSWGEETGTDYDLNIGLDQVDDASMKLLSATSGFNISEILWPLGHDFFNVNNSLGTTAHGTPQDEDSRWFKVYTKAFMTTVRIIDRFQTVAPVKIVIVPGNHDAERVMYFGHALWAWYKNCPNVTVDIGPKPYKFYAFGKNLIGMTHGKDIKNDKLPLLMATEVPEMWAKARFWEWHIGHYHHKNSTVYLPLQEFNGVRVRTLPSLCARDSWHTLHGYGGLKEAVALIWHKTEGNIAEFSFHVRQNENRKES
jgi:hypothetical protein